jgi:hypothetical protein
MSSLRSVVAMLQAVAVTTALAAFCPCDVPAKKNAANPHACCEGTEVALRASGAGCCGHCGSGDTVVSAEPAGDSGKAIALGLAVVIVTPYPSLQKAALRFSAQSVIDGSVARSAPTPLRI